MTKHNDTKPSPTATASDELVAIETIETASLDDVTGGCARCGCGNGTTQTAQTMQYASANWIR